MHVERNVFDSTLKHLFGEWDIVEVRKDMEEARIKWHMWLHQDLKGANYVKPQAPYVFTRDEKIISWFC
jgi:hypothetical protein